MSFIRKSISTTFAASVLGACAFPVLAADPAEGYGRAGGTANWNITADVSSTNGERVYGALTPTETILGRAGRSTGSQAVAQSAMWDSNSTQPPALPSVPGRQGAPMSIDAING